MTIHVTLKEHEIRTIAPGERRAFARLERFDRANAVRAGDTVFDWQRRNAVRAKSHVGVVAVEGLVVEVLPKIDLDLAADDGARARSNLLTMLAYAGELPFRERDLAPQSDAPERLLDVLVAAFLTRLESEIRRGIDRAYHDIEETASFIRGKLLIAEQIRKNAVHRERFALRYSTFGHDTPINRIFRSSCRRLLALSGDRNRRRLHRIIDELDGVMDQETVIADFDRVTFTRSNERFRPLVDFCRLLFHRQSPTLAVGDASSFALFFPMERVFESFVAGFIVAHAAELGLERHLIHPQAAHRRLPLLRTSSGADAYVLRPDLIIDLPGGPLIIDTKWKSIARSASKTPGPSPADIYQLHAYLTRYAAPRAVLLYPQSSAAVSQSFHPAVHPTSTISVRTLDLSRDLRNERNAVIRDVKELVGELGQ